MRVGKVRSDWGPKSGDGSLEHECPVRAVRHGRVPLRRQSHAPTVLRLCQYTTANARFLKFLDENTDHKQIEQISQMLRRRQACAYLDEPYIVGHSGLLTDYRRHTSNFVFEGYFARLACLLDRLRLRSIQFRTRLTDCSDSQFVKRDRPHFTMGRLVRLPHRPTGIN